MAPCEIFVNTDLGVLAIHNHFVAVLSWLGVLSLDKFDSRNSESRRNYGCQGLELTLYDSYPKRSLTSFLLLVYRSFTLSCRNK